MKIMVIEDDTIMLRYVCSLLKETGHKVIPVNNTWMAFKYIMEKPVDIIISDVMIPNFSAFGFMEWVSTLFNNSIPFIFISANEKEEFVKQAYGIGASYYLIKPVNPERLLYCVDHCISKI